VEKEPFLDLDEDPQGNDEVARLRKELEKVKEERDIIKRQRRTLPRSSSEVRLCPSSLSRVSSQPDVPSASDQSQRLL
jgi:hypothetical protein